MKPLDAINQTEDDKYMKWIVVVITGAVIGATVWLAAFGQMPEDLGLVITGAAIGLAGVAFLARLEDNK